MNSADLTARRTILVTGATRGIGRASARRLAKLGERVVLGARDPGRGAEVADRIAAEGGAAEVLPLDLASFESVRAAAARFAATHASLDVLVHNAGIALRHREVSRDGHERTWQTNFLGAYLLTALLMPALRRSPKPRVVSVSSEAHAMGRIDWDDLELRSLYDGFRAYANSKLAQLLFTRELARREPGVAANAVHPGAVVTRVWRDRPRLPVRAMVHSIAWLAGTGLPTPSRGAAPVVRLATGSGLDGVTGRYFRRFREVDPSPAARDDTAAARLWELAAKQTGLES